MKDYLIWLSSGKCIEGSMDDQEANTLKSAFKNKRWNPDVCEFADTDGIFLVEMGKVDAVSISNPCNKDEIGFTTETP